jgi:predicted Zn-dependent protease
MKATLFPIKSKGQWRSQKERRCPAAIGWGMVLVMVGSLPVAAYEPLKTEFGAKKIWAQKELRVAWKESNAQKTPAHRSALKKALLQWDRAACGSPQLRWEKDPTKADILISFSPSPWPFKKSLAAHTDVDANPRKGLVTGAHISLNPAQTPELNLARLLAHEVGHALGLGHSRHQEAVMRAGLTRDAGGPGVLALDDLAGLCSLYPETPAPFQERVAARHWARTALN